jgi:hypothetical protein
MVPLLSEPDTGMRFIIVFHYLYMKIRAGRVSDGSADVVDVVYVNM